MGKSTFFPKEWNEDQVISAINEAYKNKVPNPKVTDSFRGESNGVIIDMFIKNGKIESAFPIWPQ